MICETITETSNIFVQGNYDAEAIFVVDTEESSITINDITVKNISGEIVIDGFDKLVQQDGTNKFIDCDMTDFPILTPGVNTITVSGAATVTVKYYPIYV
ncbi:hypothetical protein SDC9_199239 [bioreactor metagenome]|uniref:Siphovirus-type tail component C-terminal domain-containing protein n=1 Tax=bioreactor metagenome TaxID=1076179 RepID=A0A645IJX1_9ZZZZ